MQNLQYKNELMISQPPPSRMGFYLTLTLILTILLGAFSVNAHEMRPAIIDLDLQDDNRFILKIRSNIEMQMAEIDPDLSDTDQSENAPKYDELRALTTAELATEFERFKPQLVAGMFLQVDGQPVALQFESISTEDVSDFELVRDSFISFTGELPASGKILTWSWQREFGPAAFRMTSPDNPDLYSTYLRSGVQSADISLASQTAVNESAAQVFVDYLIIGFEHILPKGLDHILFVIGLFLLSARFTTLLWQVSSFTLAHTITLAMGVLGIVNVSPAIVEPLIAASIVYVCVENIFSDKLNPWRPFIILVFGLLHGLGFAGVLMEVGLNEQQLITGLIAFNIGVELGQLTVIGLCFLAVGIWFKDKPWYRQRITIPASAVIACIGAYWVVERTLLA